ncbi:MAG: hypothetical protein L3J76_05120 [Candidatus Hydrothermae bacterium]|nr:hypothetical protein [Candidatus Hydrothermae bacterium]
MGRRFEGMRGWGMLLALLSLSAAECTPHLVKTTRLFSLTDLPRGTWGMAVAHDTLWTGPLHVTPFGLTVHGRPFPTKSVSCLAYVQPGDLHKERRRALWAAVGWAGTALVGISVYLHLLEQNPGYREAHEQLQVPRPEVLLGILSAFLMFSRNMERMRRLRPHPHFVALDRSPRAPPDPLHCAETLQFYTPLLDRRTPEVIPLNEEGTE